MYDPTIGRWITEDPAGFEAEDDNLYRYAKNSPTNETDPSGLVGVSAHIQILNETLAQIGRGFPPAPQNPPPAAARPYWLYGALTGASIAATIEVFHQAATGLVRTSIREAVMAHISSFGGPGPRAASFEYTGNIRALADNGGAGDLDRQVQRFSDLLQTQNFTQINVRPTAFVFYAAEGPLTPPRSGNVNFRVTFRIMGTAIPPGQLQPVPVDEIAGSFRGEFHDNNLMTTTLTN